MCSFTWWSSNRRELFLSAVITLDGNSSKCGDNLWKQGNQPDWPEMVWCHHCVQQTHTQILYIHTIFAHEKTILKFPTEWTILHRQLNCIKDGAKKQPDEQTHTQTHTLLSADQHLQHVREAWCRRAAKLQNRTQSAMFSSLACRLSRC